MSTQNRGQEPAILVTGLSGNLGQHLAPLLKEHPLVGVDLYRPRVDHPQVEFCQLDLSQPDAPALLQICGLSLSVVLVAGSLAGAARGVSLFRRLLCDEHRATGTPAWAPVCRNRTAHNGRGHARHRGSLTTTAMRRPVENLFNRNVEKLVEKARSAKLSCSRPSCSFELHTNSAARPDATDLFSDATARAGSLAKELPPRTQSGAWRSDERDC